MNRWLRVFITILGTLLAAALILPLIIPIPPAEETRPASELAGEGSLFLEINDLTVHMQQAGSGGLPLILLHGFGASVFSWREVLQPLASDRLVAAYDRPAFGLTERPMPPFPNGGNPYTPASQVELTIGFMDSLGVNQAVLIGNSAGGTIAMLTALEYPQRVAALILVDPAVYAGGGAPAWIRPILRLPQVRRIGPLFVRNIRDWGREMLLSAWHDPALITPDIVNGYTLPLSVENWDRALWELTIASQESDLSGRLGEFSLPILIITGDDDRIVPTADSVRLAGEIPGAELVVVPNCGHVPQEECPEAFLAAVDAFLLSLSNRE
ncbi:MAG: alpha/beta hydrolase [Anaerolineales bacterium]|nr:alpha/beta hydrolase [Anaerolineales bacterium]